MTVSSKKDGETAPPGREISQGVKELLPDANG